MSALDIPAITARLEAVVWPNEQALEDIRVLLAEVERLTQEYAEACAAIRQLEQNVRDCRAALDETRTALRPFVTGPYAEEVLEAAELAQWDARLRLPVQYTQHVETALTVGDLVRARAVLSPPETGDP